MEDFSTSGASLFMGVPVESGTSVTLSAESQSFAGVVRYCSVGPNGYLIGVEFEAAAAEDSDKPSNFHPKHLLDVSRLGLKDRE